MIHFLSYLSLNIFARNKYKKIVLDGWYYPAPPKKSDAGSCGQLQYSGSEGAVTSPNWPSNYNHNLDCKYYITAQANSKIVLKLQDMKVTYGDEVTVSRKVT